MAIIELEREGTVALIRMNNVKNTQNLFFAQTMKSLLDEVENDAGITALVITSTDEKNWSQGIDLEWLTQQINEKNNEAARGFFLGMDEVYAGLLLLSVPAIAAITGHAFGNGAFLASACDYRFMNAHRGFFCFPEIDLKMDFQPGIVTMLAHKLPYIKLMDLIMSGRRATAAELEEHHIVEKACAGVAETIEESLAFAESFTKDRKIFAQHKKRFNGEMVAKMIRENKEYFKSVFP